MNSLTYYVYCDGIIYTQFFPLASFIDINKHSKSGTFQNEKSFFIKQSLGFIIWFEYI